MLIVPSTVLCVGESRQSKKQNMSVAIHMSAEPIIQQTAIYLSHFVFCTLETLSFCGLSTRLLVTSFTLLFAHFMALSHSLSISSSIELGKIALNSHELTN